MKFLIFLFLILFFCICQNLSVQEFNLKNKELDSLIENNQTYQAIKLATSLTKSNYPVIKKKLFLLYLHNEQYELAKKQLELYSAYQLDEIENQYLESLYLFHTEKLEESKKKLNEIFKKKSSQLEVSFLLFKINYRQKNWKELKDNLSEMIKVNYQSPLVFEALMNYYLKVSKDFDLAKKTLKDYKDSLQNQFIYLLEQANYFYLNNKLDFALVYINNALRKKKKENRSMELKYHILKKFYHKQLKSFLIKKQSYFKKKKN